MSINQYVTPLILTTEIGSRTPISRDLVPQKSSPENPEVKGDWGAIERSDITATELCINCNN